MNEKKDVRKALWGVGWLFYGIVVAILIFLGVLFYQGFKGFFIKTYLLTKNELASLVVVETDADYTFDRIAFYDYDIASREELSLNVSLDQYSQILDLLNGSTEAKFDQYLLSQFEKENLAKLIIYLKPMDQTDGTLGLPYQKIEFIKNSGYFRIERVDKDGPNIWDYYRSPGVYFEILKVLERKV